MLNNFSIFFRTKRFYLILSCATFMLISACGGGGSSEPSVTHSSVLSGVNEVSPVATIGSGTGTATLFTNTRELTGSIQLTNLTATVAHIHLGAVGVNGTPFVTLVNQPLGSSKWVVPAGTVLTEAQATAFTTNGLYFNVHTTANTGGEIRGQIPSVAIPTTTFTSVLSGANENPPVVSNGSGTGIATLITSTRALIGSIQLTNLTATVAHIHPGAVGVNGTPFVTLVNQPLGSSKWVVPAGTVLTEAQATAFTTNGLYFNVHTAANTGGEIRGQIQSVAMPTTPATPPVPSTGY